MYLPQRKVVPRIAVVCRNSSAAGYLYVAVVELSALVIGGHFRLHDDVCLHINLIFPLIYIQHNQCPCRCLLLERMSSAISKYKTEIHSSHLIAITARR